MQLALLHRALGPDTAPSNSTVWRTCLREIHFLSGESVRDAAAVTGAEAYALLLEVVCGLRSPIIGETEVQAQFKQFLASPAAASHPQLPQLGQRLLADAKKIRHKHLQGFGAHSYGQLTAQHVTGSHLTVIGTGALACQVIMSVPDTLPIDVWGRNRARLTPPRPRDVAFFELGGPRHPHRRAPSTTLVVAAPVGYHDLTCVVECYEAVERAIDLRSLDQLTAIPVEAPVVLLSELLSTPTLSEFDGASRLRAARADVQRLAQLFHARARSLRHLPPIVGCDDVCA